MRNVFSMSEFISEFSNPSVFAFHTSLTKPLESKKTCWVKVNLGGSLGPRLKALEKGA